MYATTADLATYLGVDADDLPSDAARLLTRAGELFDSVTLGRFGDEATVEADATALARAKRAECAQVEYWIEAGEDSDIQGGITAYKAGSVSIQRRPGQTGSGSSNRDRVSPRARDALFLGGFLNGGVRVRSGGAWSEGEDE